MFEIIESFKYYENGEKLVFEINLLGNFSNMGH